MHQQNHFHVKFLKTIFQRIVGLSKKDSKWATFWHPKNRSEWKKRLTGILSAPRNEIALARLRRRTRSTVPSPIDLLVVTNGSVSKDARWPACQKCYSISRDNQPNLKSGFSFSNIKEAINLSSRFLFLKSTISLFFPFSFLFFFWKFTLKKTCFFVCFRSLLFSVSFSLLCIV